MQSDAQPPAHNPAFSGLHLPFVGFSFTKDSKLSDLGGLLVPAGSGEVLGVKATPVKGVDGGGGGEVTEVDGLTVKAYERRIQRLEDEKKELSRKIDVQNKALQNYAHGPPLKDAAPAAPDNDASARDNEIGQLKSEIEAMAKKNEGKAKLKYIFNTYP